KLFHHDLLEVFDDDFGFTNRLNNSIKVIGYSTNLSIEIIEKAAENNVDLLLTHHDAWDFIYGLKEECIKKLTEYNMSHFWIHGPLDYIDFGTSTSLMNKLGIDKLLKPSIFTDGGETPGIGEFKVAVGFDVLVDKMCNELSEPIRAWRNNDKEIKRVGVLTGAGHATNHLKTALDEGCDTYITGEATLYTIQYAQFAGINLLVGSHTYTEIFGVESLAKKIQDLDDDIKIVRLEESHFELDQ
ncbi:MAG: Nif3-like dinuclear metal center hexameric protein, partial [Mesobacillus sp.]|uniref:Nif3-like dinuclear metal center hexameric protein n=1 Tax=Mesobacillus sp. TaxID=2675271 RepID=UPI003C545D51